MELDLSRIRSIATGAVRVTEEDGGFNFYRFTAEQQELYKNRNQDFYKKSFSASGVTLRFKTDSETLFLKVFLSSASSRSYFSIEVFADGKPIGAIENFKDTEKLADYGAFEYPLGEFSGSFCLGIGEKEICIYLPWSVKTAIKELTVDDGAYIEPVKPKNKLLCFGDSITQGYDALHPSKKYTTQLSRFLDAEEYNKGIGGELFLAEMGELKEDFIPDYITVAYGTNDWSCCSREGVIHHCTGFLRAVSENYPDSKIFVITPIWRKDHRDEKRFGSFSDMAECIKNIAAELKNVKVIEGFDLVPHNQELFGDLRLHPNDEGFTRYFESLSEKIVK